MDSNYKGGMMKNAYFSFLFTVLMMIAAYTCIAQEIVQPYPDGGPYDPKTEHNIDNYLRSWKNGPPRQVHGNVVVHDILVKGESLDPPYPGAVLNYINSFSYAWLVSRAETPPEALDSEQEIMYFVSGSGTITAGNDMYTLGKGVAVFIPSNLQFSLANTGTDSLEFYLVNEPTPPGFKPRKDLLIKDANTLQFTSIGGHWWHKVKTLFTEADGLAQTENILQVTFDPMTLGHPHIYPAGQLEIWCQAEGTTTCWIGKQIRVQTPGMAYMVPPDGRVSHSNINATDSEAVFFYVFSTPK